MWGGGAEAKFNQEVYSVDYFCHFLFIHKISGATPVLMLS